MNDERDTVDIPILACMTRRREPERGSGHSLTDPIYPNGSRIVTAPPLLEGTAPASV
jgi:hypothetical protein